MNRTLAIACLASLNLLAAGCGNDDSCVEVCEGLKECSNASDELKAEDCEATCEDERASAETTDCGEPQEKLYDCAADDEELCETGMMDSCAEEVVAAISCFQAYCSDNPGSSVCASE